MRARTRLEVSAACTRHDVTKQSGRPARGHGWVASGREGAARGNAWGGAVRARRAGAAVAGHRRGWAASRHGKGAVDDARAR